MFRTPFAVVEIDEYALASRRLGGLHVAPSVTDHDAAMAVKIQTLGRSQQHARFGFPTIAIVSGIMIANFDGIDWHGFAQFLMHLLNNRLVDETIADIWLIGHDDKL